MPLQSKAQQYKPDKIDFAVLSDRSFGVLGKRPFRWQLEAAQYILCGEDVVLDVGTGSGKTLCFSLPLLLNEKDIAVTVSPLTALMIDQAGSSKISTIAVVSCVQSLKLYQVSRLQEDVNFPIC